MRVGSRLVRTRRGVRLALAGALAALLTAACGGSGAATDSGGGLEKSTLTVGIMPIVGTAPFFLAKQEGFFKDEGLTVKHTLIAGGAEGIPKLQAGDIDITYSNYVSMFQALSKGIQLRVLADGYNAEKGALAVMAMPDSGIQEPKDLAGKTIAVNTLDNQAVLTTKSVLDTHGVDISSLEFSAMPFPDVPAALSSDSVDAGFLVEPFISAVETKMGGHKVVDISTGATKGWPTAGYATTQEFYKKYPDAAQAFSRAMQRGAELAHDRGAVEKVIPTYTEITPETVAIISIGEFPTTVEETRIQRVSDLMVKYGLLDKKLDAKRLIPQGVQ